MVLHSLILRPFLMTLQAYAISAIAHWDWPEAWPNLFGHLMQALTSGDSNLVHGAMRVLTGTFCVFTSFNPLSPNIYIQIPQTDLYTFPLRIS